MKEIGKMKEQLAFEIVDEFDDCAGGRECIADKIMAAYIKGFEKAKELLIKQGDFVKTVFDRELTDLDIIELGEEEVK